MKLFLNLSLVVILAVCTSFQSDKVSVRKMKPGNFRMLVISDLNAAYGDTTYSPDVANTIKELSAIKPDLILCGGDMVAGQKAGLTDGNIRAMWRNFDEVVLRPVARLKIPFGFTLGNHDASPNFSRDRELSREFWMKNKEQTHLDFVDSSHYPFYFSYTRQNVFLMSWDASGAKIKPEVYAWMRAQLQTPAAKKAGLKIVIGHLPLYAIVQSKNKPGEVNAQPDSALAFFKANGIDLYISGHQHAYFPAHKNGVQLLNLGCIGDGPRAILGHHEPAKKAYTIIEIPQDKPENFTYHTFMPTTNQEINLNMLPDSVAGFNGTIRKRDW